jgi:hypothetical protein
MVTALLLLAAFLVQGTWALAGTTGGISGSVADANGAPVANATVVATSPSQRAQTTTDASGHYVFLALAPDTYTVSVAKADYNAASITGVTVFADNNASENITLTPALKTIAHTTSKSSGSLVKSGVTADVYSVNAAAVQAASALGGGGNLNSAYSAIASVPGVTVMVGGSGWDSNFVYVRGSQSFFSGYEYDGIPVNRAFDNYNSSTESNLGLQELQVYTGGGPSSNSSAGTSGFINQVIKTGTYPGYATLKGGIGGPTFYHSLEVEAGGATPDRNFSYYIGLSGYNQDFRLIDNQDGASYMQPGGVYGGYGIANALVPFFSGDASLCDDINSATPGATPDGVTSLPWWDSTGPYAGLLGQQTYCLQQYPGSYGAQSMISDRENIINLHFAIPHKNGLRDDLQLLWSASALNTTFASSPNDAGGPANYTLGITGLPYATAQAFGLYPQYVDAQVYDLPFGTPIAGASLQNYYQPSSPEQRELHSQVPDNLRDAMYNDTGIVKLQYTHELNANAFVRAFGYTFFSDWTQAGADSAWNCYSFGTGPTDCGSTPNYDLITHTAGGELQIADQLNAQHLVELTANYTTATVSRYNNTGYIAGSSPIGAFDQTANGFQCWDEDQTSANYDTQVGCYSSAYKSDSVDGPTGAIGPNGAAAGADWRSLWDGNSNGSINTVKPKFTVVSLTDEWRPNDKLLLNFGLRYDSFQYDLRSQPSEATQFYADIIKEGICVNNVGTVYSTTLLPGEPPPAAPIYTATCPTGYAHSAFSAAAPSVYTIRDLSPRFSATYTQSPDTVWRLSVGRYTEPPISASLQYLDSSGDARSIWVATLPLGFTSSFHPIPAMSATQADISLEHHIHGTAWSYKLTPFFNHTAGYQEQTFIGPNFVTQAPVGQFRSYGVEASVQYGDLNQNGLSGQLALTYTHARVQYQNYFGVNQIATVNSAITEFNKLTKNGGGSPCYKPANDPSNTNAGVGDGVDCSYVAANGQGAIGNPYYAMAPQSTFDPNGWYKPADVGISLTSNPFTSYFDSPWVGSLMLNYKHDRFTITPTVQLVQGSSYGEPTDVIGLDPRECGVNSSSSTYYDPSGDGSSDATVPITSVSPNTNPLQCNFYTNYGSASQASGYFYIPNPQTGSFSSFGEYQNPWLLVANVAASYELSPRVTAKLTIANLYHTCFGGSKEPWTAAYPPGKAFCAYGPNGFYAANFYNGTSASDRAANGFAAYPWQTNSYSPGTGSDAGFLPAPLNVYLQLSIKL